MSAGFTPERCALAISRVTGFTDFAAGKLTERQVEDLRIVLELARKAQGLAEASGDAL